MVACLEQEGCILWNIGLRVGIDGLKIGAEGEVDDGLFATFYVPGGIAAHKVAEEWCAQASAIAQGQSAAVGYGEG